MSSPLDVELTSILRVVGLRDPLARFAQAMQLVLEANDHKRGWEHATTAYLLRRLKQELGELERALNDKTVTTARIIHEAADVANFCMMIADNALEDSRAKTLEESS